MSAHPIDQHLPFPNNRIAVVSITRHGIALAGRIIAALPGATLFAPQKFHTEAAAAAPGAFACYEGKVGDQVPALFAGFDGIIAFVSLGAVVRSYKAAVARRVNTACHTPGAPVWQRGYHERVLRDPRGVDAVRHYIAQNPARHAARALEALLERMQLR